LWESGAHGVEKNGVIVPTLYEPSRYKQESNRTSKRRK